MMHVNSSRWPSECLRQRIVKLVSCASSWLYDDTPLVVISQLLKLVSCASSWLMTTPCRVRRVGL